MRGGDHHTDPRTARVNRDSNGTPVGVALMLGVDDLATLGVDLETAREVEYQVSHGELKIYEG